MKMFFKNKVAFLVFSVLFYFTFLSYVIDSEVTLVKNQKKNHLSNETSPYLIQHSDNPVDWYPWGSKALNKAKKDDKPLIISIGYSSCHWCHVMEKECFENDEVAEIMNKYFISIKVDREERPDIDNIYMNASQIMTGSGGWPLNIVALPNGEPFFAGTYFPKDRWMSVLKKIAMYWESDRKKLENISESVSKGIRAYGKLEMDKKENGISRLFMDKMYRNIAKRFDWKNGGFSGSPKFPLPSTLEFIMTYYYRTKSKNAISFIETTLRKMAFGGIYDQVGGGFSRYSTDRYWKVPHFEKMLYDNAQLLTIYSNAFKLTGKSLFREVVYGIAEFIEHEMVFYDKKEGYTAFYSSLDADSEGKEGKFYTWSSDELKEPMGEDHELIKKYFNISENGNWENGKNILYRTESDKIFSKNNKISIEELKKKVNKFKQNLISLRKKRISPSLDNKIVTSWNALMIRGYIDAYKAFGEKKFLVKAIEGIKFIKSKMISEDHRISRIYNVKSKNSSINGFLDDYSFTADALISLYSVTFNEDLLEDASGLIKYCLKHFYDKNSGMFNFTSDLDSELIMKNIELTDNVIPSSNSVLAINILYLGEIFYNDEYVKLSHKMMDNISGNVSSNPMFFSKWGVLADMISGNISEAVFTGKKASKNAQVLWKKFIPGLVLAGSLTNSNLAILKDRIIAGSSMIYICKNRSCRLPVTDAEKALKILEEINTEKN